MARVSEEDLAFATAYLRRCLTADHGNDAEAVVFLRHRSRGGLSRSIGVLVFDEGEGRIEDASWAVARVLGKRFDREHGGVIMHGAGTDLGFELVRALGSALKLPLRSRWL